MREMIKKFTCGNPKHMIQPVTWLTIENLFMIFPSVATMFAIQFLVTAFHGDIDFHSFWIASGILAVLFILQAVVSITAHLNTFLPAAKNNAENKTDFMEKLRRLPLGYFQKKQTGELINTFTSDFLAVEQSMVSMFTGIFSVIFSCLMTSIFFLIYAPTLAISFYISIIVAVIMVTASTKITARYTMKTVSAKDKASTYLNEYLLGMKVLKSYNQTGKGFDKLRNAYDDLVEVSLKTERFLGTLVNFACSVANVALPIVCFVGASLVLGDNLGIAEYLSIIIVSTKILVPISTYIRYTTVLRIHYVCATRIDQVLTEEELTGNENVDSLGDIIFENVSFSYDHTIDNTVLNNVSFSIPKGALTAIVGPSGSGKSTVLRLIARFWDVTNGKLMCGDTELKNTESDKWTQNISMVLQDVYLFNETIRENIRFGKDDVSEDEIISAAKKAHCHDFIMALTNGYDTVIGEGGSTLSGGEKQRISIARAILKNAPILLLDEPTASLDAKNEVAVKHAIAELVKDKTVIMIAHRLKTIQNADNILVIDKGQISECGTHNELLQNNGIYAKLWSIQSNSFEFRL